MFSSNDAAIRALTQFFDELVLGINDKGGIESGEGVPLHLRRGDNSKRVQMEVDGKMQVVVEPEEECKVDQVHGAQSDI